MIYKHSIFRRSFTKVSIDIAECFGLSSNTIENVVCNIMSKRTFSRRGISYIRIDRCSLAWDNTSRSGYCEVCSLTTISSALIDVRHLLWFTWLPFADVLLSKELVAKRNQFSKNNMASKDECTSASWAFAFFSSTLSCSEGKVLQPFSSRFHTSEFLINTSLSLSMANPNSYSEPMLVTLQRDPQGRHQSALEGLFNPSAEFREAVSLSFWPLSWATLNYTEMYLNCI